MAAKYKKQQKIQFWNHSYIQIEAEQKEQISELLKNKESEGIGEALSSYIDSKSVFTRTNELKSIKNQLNKIKTNTQLFELTIKCCLEIICSEHSRQLIKQMLSILSSLKIKEIDKKIENVIIKNINNKKVNSMIMMLFNELYEFKAVYNILKRNAIEICDYVCNVINEILNHIKHEKELVNEKEMNNVQEGISVLYAYLQSFSNEMLSNNNGKLVLKKIFMLTLMLLKEDLILRETLPTISVIFWLCISLSSLDKQITINILYYGLILKKEYEIILENSYFKNENINIINEMLNFTIFGRICCIRGIYTILDENMLCCKIEENRCLLIEALRYLCKENINSSDVNVIFQSLSTISTILEKIQKYQSNNFKKQNHNSKDIKYENLILNKEDCDIVINMLWRHFEDTVTQIERYVYLSFKTFISILDIQNKSLNIYRCIINRFNKMSDKSKGKYIPLSSLIEIYGAQNFLNEIPDFVRSILNALKEKNVCKRASSCLEVFLKQLKLEYQDDYVKWIDTWLPHLTNCLIDNDDNSNHQYNIITYLLPLILKLDNKSLIYIINALKDNLSSIIAVLRVGRQNNLIKDLDEIMKNDETSISISYEILLSGIRNESFEIHMNTLELICLHPRSKDMPGKIELELVSAAIKINSRSLSNNLRNKWMMLIKKFIERIKVSSSHAVIQQLSIIYLKITYYNIKVDVDSGLKRCEEFMQKLLLLLSEYLYPGSIHERKAMSIDMLNVILDVWKDEQWIEMPIKNDKIYKKNQKYKFQPFISKILEYEFIKILIGSSVDAWDDVRTGCITCLRKYPSPLPGIDNVESLKSILKWIIHLMNSPRLKENDAGAQLLILIYKKYVIELKWSIYIKKDNVIINDNNNNNEIIFLECLSEWLGVCIKNGKNDLLKQCENSLAHGILLCIRYLMEVFQWKCQINTKEKGKQIIKNILNAIYQCTDLCLSILSNHDTNVTSEDIELKMNYNSKARILMTATWLTMKEIAMLIGTMVTFIPLENDKWISYDDIRAMGDNLIKALITLKHNGAVEKTSYGFQLLCESLLKSIYQRYRQLPIQWLQMILKRIKEKNQKTDDIIRRSGGLPFAITSLFKSEPKNLPKVLLPMGMSEILNITYNEDYICRIHSYNCMKLIFEDKLLSNDSFPFLTTGFIRCIESFSDESWEVRNAVSLCFIALITRMVGFKNNIKNGSSQKPISAHEFFIRYPVLHGYFKDKLNQSLCDMNYHLFKKNLPPCLVPILLLLNKLKPICYSNVMTSSQFTYNNLQPSDLLLDIERCLITQYIIVRKLAAQAIIPLLNKNEIMSYMINILNKIPNDYNHFNHNSVHGYLLYLKLQLKAINEDNGSFVVLPKLFIDNIIRKLWILQEVKIAHCVKIELGEILLEIFNLDNTTTTELKRNCYPIIKDNYFYNINSSNFNFIMYELWFKTCLLIYDKIEENEAILYYEKCLQSECGYGHEIKEIIIKMIENKSYKKINLNTIFKLMIQSYESNRNFKIMTRSIRLANLILSSIKMNNRDEILKNNHIKNLLFNILKENNRPIKQKSYALCCLGYFINNENISNFIKILIEYSQTWQPVCIKIACINAINSSQILKNFEIYDNEIIGDIYIILMDLIEDEDIDVRKECKLLLLENNFKMENIKKHEHIEITERKFLKYISSNNIASLENKLISKWIITNEEDEKIMKNKENMNIILFDKEIENRREEPLMKIQLALMILSSYHKINYNSKWIEIINKYFIYIINYINMKKENLLWIGEIMNDPEIYIFIYKIIAIILIYIKYLKICNDKIIKEVILNLKILKDLSNDGYISMKFFIIINDILNYLSSSTTSTSDDDNIEFGYFYFLSDLDI